MNKKLGEKLWKQIETPQGYAYISDALCEMSDELVIEVAEIALTQAEKVVRILKKFLKDNKE
jgi:hypothetical protein